jgi:hypothetical protein
MEFLFSRSPVVISESSAMRGATHEEGLGLVLLTKAFAICWAEVTHLTAVFELSIISLSRGR